MTSDTELVERLREAARDIRNDGTPSQVGLTDAECEQVASAIERLCAERDEARALAERLKLEAQCHASEAKTANSTIYEIYQVLSGATGEPGNWHGATPAREYVTTRDAEVGRLREALAFYRDEFKPKIHKPMPGASGITYHPSEALLDDCGNRAASALSREA